MSNTLYGDIPGNGDADRFGDQLDPLGTAGSFPGTDGASPSKPLAAGAKKKGASSKGGINRKVKIWGGLFAVVVVALVVIDQTAAPKVELIPVPPAPVAHSDQGMLGGATDGPGATLMSGAPQPAEENPTPVAEIAPAAAPAPSVSTTAAMPAVETAQQTAQPQTAAAAPFQTEPAVAQARLAPEARPAVPAAAPAASTVALESRVAELERRLAQYEQNKPAAVPRKASTRPAPRKPVVRKKVAAKSAAPATSPANVPLVVDAPVPAAPKARVLSGDSVRVVGVTTRQGVRYALLEFGGVKHRVAEGEAVAGLGTVSAIAVDAGGSGVVEINGVTYR